MPKLHEVLAAEKTLNEATDKLLQETASKFQKPDSFFSGHIRTLSMIEDTPENKRLEQAGRQEKQLPTNVVKTLDYLMKFWVKSEDLLFTKNCGNQTAKADIMHNGEVLVKDVPVDELMGLESRLVKLKIVISIAPTLDAGKAWVPQAGAEEGNWMTGKPESTTKTEKIMYPVTLHPGNEHHAPQVKESTKDQVVGLFELTSFSGCITAQQKANMMTVIDELIAEIKQARIRANSIEVPQKQIGRVIADKILGALK